MRACMHVCDGNCNSASWKKILWQSLLAAYQIYIFPFFFCHITLILLKAAMLPGRLYYIAYLKAKCVHLTKFCQWHKTRSAGLELWKKSWKETDLAGRYPPLPCYFSCYKTAWNSNGTATVLAIILKSWGRSKG